VRFKALAAASEKLGSTSKRKEKIAIISEMLLHARGRETYLVAHYLAGSIPSGKIGIGWKTIQNALADLRISEKQLSLEEVQSYLEDLSRLEGSGSIRHKTSVLRELFVRLEETEGHFLARLLVGEVRQGALEALVLDALAKASSLPSNQIQQAFMFSGDTGAVAEAAMKGDKQSLESFGPRLFQPVSPMLAGSAEDEEEVLDRMGEASWEYKIDGARIQVHKQKEEVRIFTRNLKDVTERLPETVALARALPMKEAIFEGEAIALQEGGRPMPFQITMRRFGRILDVQKMQSQIPLFSYFFDLLFLDGEPLFALPYRERFNLLRSLFSPEHVIPHIVTADKTLARGFLLKSLESGHEGLMAKGLLSPYQAGRRGSHWLKLKPSLSLDLVILAAEWGHGRRRGWLSNIHLGARDPESGHFVMLGKTFKGLTDQMLQWMTSKLLSLEISRDNYTVYVKPELVVEIAYNNIQESPRYPGGLALRFARVKRFREDKSASEADTIQTVWSLFKAGR
jgi:DNA ligase-1